MTASFYIDPITLQSINGEPNVENALVIGGVIAKYSYNGRAIDKRGFSQILIGQLAEYMRDTGYIPLQARVKKRYKNGNIDILFKASLNENFTLKLNYSSVNDMPSRFIEGLRVFGPTPLKFFDIPVNFWDRPVKRTFEKSFSEPVRVDCNNGVHFGQHEEDARAVGQDDELRPYFATDFPRFLSDLGPENLTTFLVGSASIESTYIGEIGYREVVKELINNAENLQSLEALFLVAQADIPDHEVSIGDIRHGDLTPLLKVYPNLKCLAMRGKGVFGQLTHNRLEKLIIESYGLSQDTIASLENISLPNLKHLEIWLGAEWYGRTCAARDVVMAIHRANLPSLKSLALKNCDCADELIEEMIEHKEVFDGIEHLDLSESMLTDGALERLLNSEMSGNLKTVNIDNCYISGRLLRVLKNEKGKYHYSSMQGETPFDLRDIGVVRNPARDGIEELRSVYVEDPFARESWTLESDSEEISGAEALYDFAGEDTLIFELVAANDLDALQEYLAAGSFVDKTERTFERSALFYCTSEPVMETLLEACADMNHRDYYGDTALHVLESSRLVTMLLEVGASFELRNSSGCTALHAQVKAGNVDCVDCLIEHGAKVNVIDSVGDTPLMTAIVSGDVDIVRLLIQNGATVTGKNNPYEIAQRAGHITVMRLIESFDPKALVDQKASNTQAFDAIEQCDIAALRDAVKIPGTLIQQDGLDNLPIINALQKSGPFMNEAVRVLLEAGADPNAKDSRSGISVLMRLSIIGATELVDLALRCGANPNALSNVGKTALTYALSFKNNYEIAMSLLNNGADPNLFNIGKDNAPLHFACKLGDLSLVNLLIENGADVNLLGEYGYPALVYAAEHVGTGIVDALLNAGAQIEYGGNCSVLSCTARHGDLEATKRLVNAGAIANDCTALRAASRHGHLDIVRYLLEVGAGVNEQDAYGETALFGACEGGHTAVICALLSAGADVHIENEYNKSCDSCLSHEEKLNSRKNSNAWKLFSACIHSAVRDDLDPIALLKDSGVWEE